MLLLVILVAVRFPWLEADGGNFGMDAYGFFLADEGAYTDGGRIAYLTGSFFDAELAAPYTFLHSWGMHLLSYLGYCLVGLKLSAARLPTAVAAVLGWMVAYGIASRRTHPIVAGMVVLLAACNPVSLTYERTASLDTVVGACVIGAFALVTSRGIGATILGGAILALACSVKLTAYGFIPLLLLAVACSPGGVRRIAGFALAFAAATILLVGARELCMPSPDGPTAGRLSQDTVGGTIGVLLCFEPSGWIKALAIFPRWPVSTQLGPLMMLVLLLPVWMILLRFLHHRSLLSRNTLAPLGLSIYLAILATQQACNLRYFLPVLFFAPLLLIQGRLAVFRGPTASWGMKTGVLVAWVIILFLYWFPVSLDGVVLSDYHYGNYSLPRRLLWSLNGARLFLSVGILLLAVWWFFPSGNRWRKIAVAGCLAIATAQLLFCNHWNSIIDYGSPVRLFQEMSFTQNQLVSQLGLAAFTILMLSRTRSWRKWYGAWACLAVGFIIFNWHWSRAFAELAQRRFEVRTVAERLRDRLPPRSIVVGYRASTLLRNTSFRLGLGGFPRSEAEFIDRLEQVIANHPDQPVYWLVESDWNPHNLCYQAKGTDRLEFALTATVFLPYSHTSQPGPLDVVRVQVSDSGGKQAGRH